MSTESSRATWSYTYEKGLVETLQALVNIPMLRGQNGWTADIAEAGPHGPNALLLVPLKLRDGAHALSGFPPPLVSILLAPNPKNSRPPRLGAGRERQKKTLRDLGNARRKSREVGEERESHDPYL